MDRNVHDTRVTSLSGVLDELAEGTSGHEVSIGELMQAIGTRAFGPLLLVPAIIAISPIGAIPGFSILMGIIIILIATQLLGMRRHPWIPQRLEKFSFGRQRLHRTLKLIRPYAEKIDLVLKPRLDFLTGPPFVQLVAVACLVMAALMFPLALVPFGVLFPGLAVALLALGLTAHDGLLILMGLAVSLSASWLAGSWSLGAA